MPALGSCGCPRTSITPLKSAQWSSRPLPSWRSRGLRNEAIGRSSSRGNHERSFRDRATAGSLDRDSSKRYMPETTVYLVRHGTHDWLRPEHNRFAGAIPGVALNEQGRLEVQRLAGLLSGEPITWIAASPLQRTMETAEMLARARHLDVETDERLLEWRWGGRGSQKNIAVYGPGSIEWKNLRDEPESL